MTVRAAGVIAFFIAAAAGAQAAEPPRLSMPVRCTLGTDCFLQNLVDHDPGPGVSDHVCGARSYDGHDGTDFRVASLRDVARGVDVVAAADGVVKGTRDGMKDVSVRTVGRAALGGRDCGNGVTLDHGDGWATQYCHLAQGSIAVRQGAKVKRGDVLGRIGLSGNTEFPHVHFGLRKDGRAVDPFAYGRPPLACGGGTPLWAQPMPSAGRAVLLRGFADGPVAGAELDAGTVEDRRPSPGSGVVAWVRAIGLEAGDAPQLVVSGPDGTVLAETKPPPLDRAKAQYDFFVGRRTASGPGRYEARLVVRSGDRTVLEDRFTVEIGP